MFYLKSKDKQNKFLTIFNYCSVFFIVSPIILILIAINVIWISNKNFDSNKIIITCAIILSTLPPIFLIIKFFMNNKWRKMMMYEFLDIVHNSKLPSKQPKIVYVHTTKNDFMKARLLQNLEQTYPNIEVWISIGGPNDIHLNEIKKVAQEKNIKLCIMNRPSKSKADNLNYFLKNSGATFDYLLIGDADVAFDANFVETSLKIFYSDRAKRLGYVSSTIFNYRGNNVFTNAIMHFDNEKYIMQDQLTNSVMNISPNLYSACCLISNEMLQEMGGFFPNSNLEDWYTEKYANKHLWEGVISPLSVAMQSFDQNIWINLNRLSRLFTWGIKYNKEQFFINYNVKYDTQNSKDFNNLFLGFYTVLGFILTTVLIWFFLTNPQAFFSNKLLLIFLCSFLISTIINIFIKSYYAKKISPHDKFKRFILQPFYGIVLLVSFLKNWYKALFLSKYTEFDKKRGNKNLQKNIILLVTFVVIIVFGNCLFVLFSVWKINKGFMYLVVLFNCFFGLSLFYEISYCILGILWLVPSNKEYNENDFVYCNNDFVLQSKIIKEYNSKLKKRRQIKGK